MRGTKAPSHEGTTGRMLRLRAAFTLTELLIVIAIVVLLMGLAVPAFNLITGNRSVDGATNQVSAMLSFIRADAIGAQQPEGVLFFLDKYTGRTSMIPVRFATPHATPWQAGVNYKQGQYVEYQLAGTLLVQPPPVRYWVCKIDHLSSNANAPTAASLASPYSNSTPWSASGDWFLDVVPDRDTLELPKGIGAQCVYDDRWSAPAFGNGPRGDHYIRQCALLMFDKSGMLASKSYGIHPWSILGRRIGLLDVNSAQPPIFNKFSLGGANSPAIGTPFYRDSYRSQFGVVLYDLDAIRNQVSDYTERDYIPFGPKTTSGVPGRITDLDGITPGQSSTYPNETATEEAWLDNNSSPLLINRYNGTIVKGE